MTKPIAEVHPQAEGAYQDASRTIDWTAYQSAKVDWMVQQNAIASAAMQAASAHGEPTPWPARVSEHAWMEDQPSSMLPAVVGLLGIIALSVAACLLVAHLFGAF